MLAGKYGMSRAQAQAAEARLAALAEAEGLPFSADRKHGNTFDAHRLLGLAAASGRQEAVADAPYRTHFSGEASIFDPDSLAIVAGRAGLDDGQARQVLAGSEFTEQVRAEPCPEPRPRRS